MRPDPKETHKQHAFDSYCKKVLAHEASNGHREINRRALVEVPMSALPEDALVQLAVHDDYPWEYTFFHVGKDVVPVRDDRLAGALEAMGERDRDIILMYWFLDMADRDIAERLDMARRTANAHRQRAWRLLEKLMGGGTDG